jgi:membrane-bound lytic murein transglycosylase D
MLNRFFAGLICLFFISFTYAGKPEDNYFRVRLSFSDTADKKNNDSLNQLVAAPVNDLKQDFKDLFVTSLSSNDANYQQLNPMAVSFVEDYVEKFGDKIENIKEWGKPYLDMMETILVQHGLPKELKYLAVIESNLKSNARSWVGAVGPWQFMPATARNMGLKVGSKYDERKDFNKSTQAASKYLADLFSIYGDWLLVIAAYNGGTGNVNSAIRKSGSRDFWTLQRYLPTESKNHVKKFIATHYIMEGGRGGITTATREEAKNIIASTNISLTPGETANTKTQSISGRYNSSVITKHITMDIVVFNKLNPNFDRLIAAGNNYELRLPNDQMDMFLSKKPDILNESMQLLLNPGATESSRL